MNQSTLDYVTVNFPLSKLFSQKRFLVTCLDSKWSLGHETWGAIWQVIAWSLQQLGEGKAACRRHDGKSLEKANLAGKSLQKACLVQMRGDWDWNVKAFGATTFNTKLGMCWKCSCKPGEWHTMTQEDRSTHSLGKADWLANLAAREKPAMHLFNLPGVSNQTMFPDWMHVVDEGMAASVAGQCLKEFEGHCTGASKEERVNQLWGFIKDLYPKTAQIMTKGFGNSRPKILSRVRKCHQSWMLKQLKLEGSALCCTSWYSAFCLEKAQFSLGKALHTKELSKNLQNTAAQCTAAWRRQILRS